MSMQAAIRREIYFALHRAQGHQLGRWYRQFRRDDDERIGREVQRAGLAATLAHAAGNVPYYREILGAGVPWRDDPEAFLADLPILTKDVIRARFDELKSEDLATRTWSYNTSGGSTGEPIRLVQDQRHWDRAVAVQLVHGRWAGRELGQLEAAVWGSERDILDGGIGWRMRAANALIGKRYLNAFRMTAAEMDEFLDRLDSWRPRLIVAYASAIYELARYAESTGREVAPQRCVVTTSGTLYEHMREAISRVFSCPVLNRYGSREVGDIAAECLCRQGLHVFPWSTFVEIVDDEGRRVPAGVEGDVLVTSLHNEAMPLIRYAIGDRAVLGEDDGCPCGRSWQRLEKVSGRNVDTFRRADGGLVDGEYFTHLLYFRDWVQTFQVVQTDVDHILFRVVPRGEAPEADLDEIRRGALAAMQDGCRVAFEFVDEIPPSASGKYRYTMSML
jgi:phenylacetate-CoA ligase